MADGLSEAGFTLSTHKCSVKGGDRLTLTSAHPLPKEELHVLLTGSEQSHRVSAERVNTTCLLVTLPANKLAETVQLSLFTTHDNTLLYQTEFSYVMDQTQFVNELLRSVSKCEGFQTNSLPPLSSPEALREFDQTLVSAMKGVDLPPEWSLVNKSECTNNETLLHFAVRHGLNSLSQYLLSLPGSPEAVLLPDNKGQLPIDIARAQRNEGLAQLLKLYMNDVESNGVAGDSPLTSPQHATRKRAFAQPAQDLDKFKEINSQWTNQVKRFRHLSHTSLSSLDGSHALTNGTTHTHTHHIPVKRRRSSIAVMDNTENIPYVPATPLEAVQVNTRDPDLAVMERLRKTSWSRVVGSSDCRSIDTGLNELDRISAEEVIQERLVQVKTELVQLDQRKQDPSQSNQHLKLSEAQLRVMYRLSASCPSLNDDDELDYPGSAFLSATTSPGGRTASPLSEPPQSPNDYQRSNSTGPIPHVVTTDYTEEEGPTSSRSVNRQTHSESELLERERLITADGKQRANSIVALIDDHVNVEESIAEHRQLTQGSPVSTVSSEPTVRSEDDYVMISSNVSIENTPEREVSRAHSTGDSLTPVGTPSDTKDTPTRVTTPLHSNTRYKSHRRSLSSSEVEIMSSISTLTGTEPPTSSSAGGWNSPIPSIDESHLSAQNSTCDLHERSRASSLLTNETSSIRGSDTSDDEAGFLSAKESISTTSFDQITVSPTSQEEMEATDSIQDSTVKVRSSEKRERLRAAKAKRYSADYIMSSVDDYDEEELTSSLKHRANSSNLDIPSAESTPQHDLTPRSSLHLVPNDVPTQNDLSPSDIDLSFKSGENSLESSQSSLFFKTTGSPKTIKRRKGKSPLLPRRQTIAHTKYNDNRGLTKEKVGPTISALKDLIKPSDSPEIREEPAFVYSNSSEYNEEGYPSPSSIPRTPIETPPPDGEEDECTSLDFIPGSPLVRDKHKKATPSPLVVDPVKHDRELSSSPSPAPPIEEEVGKDDTSEIVESPSKSSLTSGDSSVREVRFLEQDVCPIDEGPKEKERGKWREKIFGKKPTGKNQDGESEGTLSKRPRSGRKHKYEEVVLKYVTPKEYGHETTPISPTAINRSTSMQTGMEHVGNDSSTPTHHRSTSVQVNDPPKLTAHLLKRQSEYTIGLSPSKKSESVVSGLETLEEVPADTVTPLLVPPAGGPPSGESENEQDELVRSLSVSHPVLEIQEESSWDKTVDRRLYKKLNKAERERQAILHELLQTEKNHFRVLHVLKLIFRQQMTKLTNEETIAQLFPDLDNLIEISDGFLKRLESKTHQKDDIMIDDLSDVLLEQFSGDNHDQMLHSYGIFCSGQLNATEIYKEHMKKKQFSRIMKQLHSLKECQRLTLPDYYLAVSQRLSKLLTLLKRLAKKSESLKLDHASRVRQSLKNLEDLIAAVDLTVENNKMRMEVEAIQSRLEPPRLTKFKDRRERLNFSLTAQDRRLRKRGMAEWIGHGKEISVHVILVTDMVVLLTERDQRYHLASLLDHKPPIIRLYDLHVRVNVSVKTGVQLLLLEKGSSPEMFRLEFMSKKLAREWEVALNSAIEECKDKKLKCEYFGTERVVFTEEDRKEESDIEDSIPEISNPLLKSMQRARESLAFASKLLTPGSSTTTDSSRYHGVAMASASGQFGRMNSQEQAKNRNRSQTTHRPKTAFFAEDDLPSGGSSATLAGDHIISAPIPPGKVSKAKTEKKRVKLDRSSTFRSKDKERDKSTSGEAEGVYRVPEVQYIRCITNLKDSLQEMMNMCEEKDEEIVKLRNELAVLHESSQQSSPHPSPSVPHRLSPRTSPPQPRPHSVHFDHTQSELHSQSEVLMRDDEGKGSSDGEDTPNGSLLELNED